MLVFAVAFAQKAQKPCSLACAFGVNVMVLPCLDVASMPQILVRFTATSCRHAFGGEMLLEQQMSASGCMC